MDKSLHRRLIPRGLSASVLMLAGVFLIGQPAQAETTHRIIIQDGSTALSNEQARQAKEQWDDTRSLRQKINRRAEKEFDKVDRAYDNQDSCQQSLNVNAYWEHNSMRCLDRRTGRPVQP